MFDDMFEDDELLDDADNGADGMAAPEEGALRPPRESLDIFGMAEHEKTLLSLYNQNTLPHALIFSGPMGVGKATMAFRFARFLLKHSAGSDDNQAGLFGDAPPAPTTMDVAADDPVFRKVASSGHPDLRTIERAVDDKTGLRKGTVDVESVRAIAPFLRKTTADGGWRIVIVDEADLMTRAAQNAILKILEEPPPRALLVLICNRLGAMIPTIRSRCRTFHFAPLEQRAMDDIIRRAAPADMKPEDLALLSALSDGSAGQALSFLEEGGIDTLRTVIGLLEGWPDFDWTMLHQISENLSRKGSESAYGVMAAGLDWTVRNIVRARATGGAAALPRALSGERLKPLLDHYSLEQWIDICEKLKEHFTAIDHSNLDRRQGILGAFAIIGGQI